MKPCHYGPFAVGEGRAHLCLLHFLVSAGGQVALLSHGISPPTSQLWSPLLPQTVDLRHQTDIGAHLSSHLSCSESCGVVLSSTRGLPVGLSSQGTASRPLSPHLPQDSQKILLAWSCRATQSLTTGSHCPLIRPVLFPLWLAPGSNLFIMLDKTHPP